MKKQKKQKTKVQREKVQLNKKMIRGGYNFRNNI